MSTFLLILLGVSLIVGILIFIFWCIENDHGYWAAIISVLAITIIAYICVVADQQAEQDCHNAGGVRVQTGEQMVNTGKSVIMVPEYSCVTGK
jgi:hypothetical protein